jgi:hypothetical protein
MIFMNRLRPSRAAPNAEEREQTAVAGEAEADLGVVDPE